MTRIAFDAKRIVRNASGLGNYGRTLVTSLAALMPKDELWLYAPDAGRDDLRRQVETLANVSFHYPRHARFRFQRDLWRTRGIVGDLVSDGVSLYHGLSGELPVGISQTAIPTVVTIHDLIFMRHPEWYHWLDVQIYRRKFFQAIKEATRIIAISECTRRDILHYAGGDGQLDDRISVIYQGASRQFAADELLPPSTLLHGVDQYVLQVGTIEERKNALESVMALEYLPRELHLVLVGRETQYTEQVRRYAVQHALQPRLHILSGVSNDELARLYRHAQCFVYPSRYEGFGIPIIEAIQSGLPVVAATGSCLEEAGGPDCIYVSPDDPRALADAVSQLVDNPDRQQMVERARQYIRRFDNDRVAAQVVELYGELVE